MKPWPRSIRPDNGPKDIPPASVGSDVAEPGDPHGVVVADTEPGPPNPPTRIVPSPWSGWPAEWQTPLWSGNAADLTDTAWACLDLNASVLSAMPPYLVGAAATLDTAWLTNPNPDAYASWEEFAKQLFWDFMLGEAFVLATAWYATGWPARFHVVPPWLVDCEIDRNGLRRYAIGSVDITADVLHIRYRSSVNDARGHGPLEAGAARLIADRVLARYAGQFAASGGVPASILTHPEELTPKQAGDLQAQWVAARQSTLGEPAVLSGGVTWEATQISPKDAALVELSQLTESRIAVLLGVPPFLVGLPSGGDSMTYSNVNALFDFHWRASLRQKAEHVCAALSGWLLPRDTQVQLNRDSYVQPEPLQRAQAAEIYNRIRDPQGNPALTVEEIRAVERFSLAGVAGVAQEEAIPE